MSLLQAYKNYMFLQFLGQSRATLSLCASQYGQLPLELLGFVIHA